MGTGKKKRTAFISVFAILIMVLLGFYGYKRYRIMLDDYFRHSTGAFEIPDITKGFIPQGIAYDDASDSFILTGYMGNGKGSPIYVIDKDSGKVRKKISLKTEEGKRFKGHAGGISVYGNNTYLAGSTNFCFYVFANPDIMNAEDGGTLCAGRRIDLKDGKDYIRASFTSVDDSLLYAGEFHKGLLFYTSDTHKVETGDSMQEAFLLGLTVDDGKAVPSLVYSIPDSIQGACFADGYLYLSQSNGFLPGKILSYDIENVRQQGETEVLGKNVPLYVLTETNASGTQIIPPMPEEMIVVDGRMYIAYESASNRYKIGRLLGLDKVLSTPVEYFQ